MQALELINRITLPQQSEKKLSFCASNKAQRVAEWASMLRPTQIERTSSLLYQALPEINRLITSAQSRLEMLEHLRPYVQHTLNGLSKFYLHSPLALEGEAQKSAIVSQALQKHMVDGYILCAASLLGNKKLKAGDETLALCLHRAITGLGLVFSRSYQIYAQAPKGLWLAMHSLFRIADLYELLDTKVTDDVQRTTKLSSVQDAYVRTLLMSSARPHQLNQNDIAAVYEVFGEWSSFIRFNLGLTDDPNNFYCVDLDGDFGPLYKARLGQDAENHLVIELDFRPLLSQLTKQRSEGKAKSESIEDIGASSIELPKQITPPILEHLLEAWSNIAQRKQDRRPVQVTADMCVGLADCHYYLAGGQAFSDFVTSTASASHIENTMSHGFTPRDSFSEEAQVEGPLSRVI